MSDLRSNPEKNTNHKHHQFTTSHIKYETPRVVCELTLFAVAQIPTGVSRELFARLRVIRGNMDMEAARVVRLELIKLMKKNPLFKAWRQELAI
jgi:hypothetical protein